MSDYTRFIQFIKYIELRLQNNSNSKWETVNKSFNKNGSPLFSKKEIREFINSHSICISSKLDALLKMKPTRTLSGISSVTVFTKPYMCSAHCIYCPTQENTPKSYLQDEPGIQRAISLNYDPFDQISKRIEALEFNGHPTNKIEIILSGGTWDDYPLDYRYFFVCRMFQALNNTNATDIPHNIDWRYLRKLQKINSKSKHRCVGFSIETRPDKITIESIKELRFFGITKVQLGIQSLHDDILLSNARGHDSRKAIEAVDLLRKNGFKIVIHWMCNLYKSTPQIDLEDFIMLFKPKSIQPDEIKIYPCSLLSGTILYHYYKQGKYQPYSDDVLIDLLIKCKLKIPIYTRVSRLFRDIPSNNIIEGNTKTNLRQLVQKEMKLRNLSCHCIRCREIQNQNVTFSTLRKSLKKYITNIGTEYFISFNSPENKLAGFLRLAIYNDDKNIIHSRAMIREIHVYGQSTSVGEYHSGKAQHTGIGKKLIKIAEIITLRENINRLAVISSVGTWEYYKKLGFVIDKTYGYGIKALPI